LILKLTHFAAGTSVNTVVEFPGSSSIVPTFGAVLKNIRLLFGGAIDEIYK
jgi:hypothetical protein